MILVRALFLQTGYKEMIEHVCALESSLYGEIKFYKSLIRIISLSVDHD